MLDIQQVLSDHTMKYMFTVTFCQTKFLSEYPFDAPGMEFLYHLFT